jgi:hypothetical protein
MAFVVLALLAAGLVGVQRADAQAGRLLAAVAGVDARVHGTVPVTPGLVTTAARERAAAMGPLFEAVASLADGSGAEAPAAGAPPRSERATPRDTGPARSARPGVLAGPEPAATPRRANAAKAQRVADRTDAGARAARPVAHVLRFTERRVTRVEKKAVRRVARAEQKADRWAARVERKADRWAVKAERKADRWTARAERLAQRRAQLAERRAERAERRAERRVERAERWDARAERRIARVSARASGGARGSGLRHHFRRGRGAKHPVAHSAGHGSAWPWGR